MTWRNRATCLGDDPELFFPIGNTGPALVQIEEAKAICRRCEVVDTCLRWAMESGADTGVWPARRKRPRPPATAKAAPLTTHLSQGSQQDRH
jgi:WhiB family redox-sensing transcriptional regulator